LLKARIPRQCPVIYLDHTRGGRGIPPPEIGVKYYLSVEMLSETVSVKCASIVDPTNFNS
jgi:hypothetical protein